MQKWDITELMVEQETPESRAFDHALELTYLISIEMEKRGITQKELAEKMGMPASRLSKLLNKQTNMTLETIAKFEIALDVFLELSFEQSDDMAFQMKISDYYSINPVTPSAKGKKAAVVMSDAGKVELSYGFEADLRHAQNKKKTPAEPIELGVAA